MASGQACAMTVNPYQSPTEPPRPKRSIAIWLIVLVVISLPVCGCCLWPTLVDVVRWLSG